VAKAKVVAGKLIAVETTAKGTQKAISNPNNIVGYVISNIMEKRHGRGWRTTVSVHDVNPLMRSIGNLVSRELVKQGFDPVKESVHKKSGKVSYRSIDRLALAIGFNEATLLKAVMEREKELQAATKQATKQAA
jgi:hypothetical protein